MIGWTDVGEDLGTLQEEACKGPESWGSLEDKRKADIDSPEVPETPPGQAMDLGRIPELLGRHRPCTTARTGQNTLTWLDSHAGSDQG